MDDPEATKEKAREYMDRRKIERREVDRKPLHEIEQIRRELGWDPVGRRIGERRKE